MTTGPLVMRIMALSIKVAGAAGSIIRDVMTKGNLGVVDKVLKWTFRFGIFRH